jgi:hypothetical protein
MGMTQLKSIECIFFPVQFCSKEKVNLPHKIRQKACALGSLHPNPRTKIQIQYFRASTAFPRSLRHNCEIYHMVGRSFLFPCLCQPLSFVVIHRIATVSTSRSLSIPWVPQFCCSARDRGKPLGCNPFDIVTNSLVFSYKTKQPVILFSERERAYSCIEAPVIIEKIKYP